MKYFTKSSMYNVHMKIQMHSEPIVVRGKYNQIAAFWNPIVCMIYMAAVLIQLLTLKHLLHFLQAIINYAEKLCFFFKYLSKFQKTTKMLENPQMNVG